MYETMKTSDNRNDILTRSYNANYGRVLGFVTSRINSPEDAENIAQDVWLRLLEYDKPISEDSLLPLLYTVATNLVNDYLRRLYRSRAAYSAMFDCADELDSSCESGIFARDIAKIERERVECLPQQRRIIYVMSRFDDKSVADIADELSLSFRTVENHLRLGRRDIRSYMAEAI